MICLSSKKLQAARWLMWASLQKHIIYFSQCNGLRLATFPEAIEFGRQTYDALKAGTEGAAYKIIRRVQHPVSYEFDSSEVGLDAPMSL